MTFGRVEDCVDLLMFLSTSIVMAARHRGDFCWSSIFELSGQHADQEHGET
jgi:hypothetical protein